MHKLVNKHIFQHNKKGRGCSPPRLSLYWHTIPIFLPPRSVASVGNVSEPAAEHLDVLKRSCAVSVPFAGAFASGDIALEDDGVVGLELDDVAVAAVVGAIVSALDGQRLPAVCLRVVANCLDLFVGEIVVHDASFPFVGLPYQTLWHPV